MVYVGLNPRLEAARVICPVPAQNSKDLRGRRDGGGQADHPVGPRWVGAIRV